MMTVRTIAMAGVVSVGLALPGVAQTTGPADSGVQHNDQSVRTEPAPAAPLEASPPAELKAEPPTRTDDEFDLPPAGCRYRDNKLDLIV